MNKPLFKEIHLMRDHQTASSTKSTRPNKLATVIINYEGIERTMRQWCQLLTLNYVTVRMRYIRGERDTAVLFKPTPVPRKNNLNTMPKAAKLTSVTYVQAFYDLPIEVRQLIRSECEFDPVRVRAYITKAVVDYVQRSAGANMPKPRTYHPDDAPVRTSQQRPASNGLEELEAEIEGFLPFP